MGTENLSPNAVVMKSVKDRVCFEDSGCPEWGLFARGRSHCCLSPPPELGTGHRTGSH